MIRIALMLLLLTAQAATAVEFEVYQSGFTPLRLAWIVLGDTAEKEEVWRIVRQDLESSRSFSALDPLSFLVNPEQAWNAKDYGDWRIIGTDILAVARLSRQGSRLQASLQVHDPFGNKMLASTQLEADTKGLRALAHRLADAVYEAATGIQGHFTSHILYVRKRGRTADLIYMDQDGANRHVIGKNFTLILSPEWSPDNRRIAVNTYVGNRPRLEMIELATGKREIFGAFRGLNSTPAWSPDGQYIAATLSYTGNAEIHLYDTLSRTWRQLTHHPAIDTSPSWSPDGQWLAFTSDRSGSPQIYKMRLADGKVFRVSLQNDYNTSPAWSPRGDRIAFITLKNWEFALATCKPDGSDVRYLVTGKRIESPSWSPNGQMLIYSEDVNGLRQVFRIPSWGGEPEAITPPDEDASDPAWSR